MLLCSPVTSRFADRATLWAIALTTDRPDYLSIIMDSWKNLRLAARLYAQCVILALAGSIGPAGVGGGVHIIAALSAPDLMQDMQKA